MTTAMIEIRLFNAEKQIETTVAPFAWFEWPGLMLSIAWNALKTAMVMTAGGRATTHRRQFPKTTIVHKSTAPVKETRTEWAMRMKRTNEVTDWRDMPPILSHRIYKDKDDFEVAKAR